MNLIQIQLKTIGMQICKKIYSIFSCEYVVGKNKLIHKYEKTPFHSFSFGNELTNSNLELSNVWQLEEPKVVLPKLVPLNHCHWN